MKNSTYCNILSEGNKIITKASPVSPIQHLEDDGWTQVKKGFKPSSKATAASNKLVTNVAQGSSTSNKFAVPKALEKKLHHNSAVTALCGVKGPGSARCQKRNQRRNRKRNKLGSQKKMSDATPNKDICVKEVAMTTSSYDISMTSLCDDAWGSIVSFLSPQDVLTFGCCNKQTKKLSEEGHVWETLFKREFPSSTLTPLCATEFKLAFKLMKSNDVQHLRCQKTKLSFFEKILGVGIDFTINPKTKHVDYISMSQDIISEEAFHENGAKTDVFGEEYKLFLPLYFSQHHFERALPTIKKIIKGLTTHFYSSSFDPSMILDVFPKIVNTFVVLVADSGLTASRKTFNGLLRIHRLFLALAHQYPCIKQEALLRLRNFVGDECNRTKSSCPSLGNLLPLLLIIDQDKFEWANMWRTYIGESLDRSVLWACKEFPELESLVGLSADERLRKMFNATKVSRRLTMINVYFNFLLCRGSTRDRALTYDTFYSNPDTDRTSELNKYLNYQTFRYQIHRIMNVNSWQGFYKFALSPCPSSKAQMCLMLKESVRNSLRKGYHKRNMNFAAIHKSGTSKILAKGEKYSSGGMRRVRFEDNWSFRENTDTIFLDATCLVYKGKKRVSTIDYCNRFCAGNAIAHSGDQIHGTTGLHTIDLNLAALDREVTSLFFVLSAWSEATLLDVESAAISFQDLDSDKMLCVYNLDSHDKISHLKSIIMCKLYRTAGDDNWHVVAIGDSHRGSADNYGPIYDAVQKLL
jgi:stress response protein SCP2